MNTEFAIIINPTSGGGRAKARWTELEKALILKAIPFKTFESQYDRHAVELAKIAVNEGYTHLIAVGGDGTISQLANGILSLDSAKRQGIAITLFSCGTGNDWVRAHGIPTDVNAFVLRLKNLNYGYQDAAKIILMAQENEQIFYAINVIGLAYDAFVAKKSASRKSTPWSGKFYLLHVLSSLFDYQPETISIKSSEKQITDNLYTINIGVCPFSGGNMMLVPHADPNDNLLAVTVVKSIPKWEVILKTPMFYNGKIGEHRASELWQTESIEIYAETGKQTGIEADGDYIGQTPVKIESMSNVIRIFGI